MSYQKECCICGKIFEARQSNYRTCSVACSRVNAHNLSRKWNSIHSSVPKPKLPNRFPERKCRLCGGLIRSYEYSGSTKNPLMHDECVYLDCVNTLKSGNILSSAQYQRLKMRMGLKEFYAFYFPVRIYGKIKWS